MNKINSLKVINNYTIEYKITIFIKCIENTIKLNFQLTLYMI